MASNFRIPNLYVENIYNVFKPQKGEKGTIFTTDSAGKIISLLPPSTDGLVLGYDSTATFGVHWVADTDSTSTFPPTAGPGTIFVYNSSGNVVAFPPGLPGQYLSMSAITLGELEWTTPPTSGGGSAVDTITGTTFTTTLITISDLITLDITTITLGSYNYFYVEGKAVMKSITGPLRGAAYTERTLFKRNGSVVEENPGGGCDDRLVFEDELDTNYQKGQGFDASFASDSTNIYFRVQQPTSATMNFSWQGVLEYTAV
jgi:hypothetical protein